MRKLIYKVKLKNRDEFEARLAELDFDFGPMYWQHSRTFVPRNYQSHGNFPRMILRIEMKAVDRPAKYELICKRHIEDSGVTILHNTQVKDYAEAANILMQLGFVMQAEIPRRRQELDVNAKTKVYLDKVDTLSGFYAKIEINIDNDGEVATARKELEQLLEEFGIMGQAQVRETYAEL